MFVFRTFYFRTFFDSIFGRISKGKIDILRALKRLLLHENIYIKTILRVRKDLLPRNPSQDLMPP